MADSSQHLRLYRGFPPDNAHVWSPFVTKLELRLRLGGLRYKLEQGDPRSGPRGKIPYVDVAPLHKKSTPELLGDTSLITKRLIADGNLVDLNANLSARDAAFDLSLRALCEDKIYFYEQRERWAGPNFHTQREKLFAPLSRPMRVVIGSIVYRFIGLGLHFQGSGRYTEPEYETLRREAWANLAAILTEARKGAAPQGPFWALGGSQPTEADCTVFGSVVSNLVADSGPKGRQLVQEHEVLLDYVRRIHNEHFAGYEAAA